MGTPQTASGAAGFPDAWVPWGYLSPPAPAPEPLSAHLKVLQERMEVLEQVGPGGAGGLGAPIPHKRVLEERPPPSGRGYSGPPLTPCVWGRRWGGPCGTWTGWRLWGSS